MTDMDNAIKLVNLLLKHEEVIATYYETLANRLPQSAVFWMELVKEERMHVRLIRAIEDEVLSRCVTVDATKLTIQSVENSIDYVKEAQRMTEVSNVSMRSALASALDIEDSLTEKRVMEVFKTDDDKVAELLAAFSGTFFDHAVRIKEELRRIQVSGQ